MGAERVVDADNGPLFDVGGDEDLDAVAAVELEGHMLLRRRLWAAIGCRPVSHSVLTSVSSVQQPGHSPNNFPMFCLTFAAEHPCYVDCLTAA